SLDGRRVSAATGWKTMRRRRRPIAGWAVVESLVGLPSRAVGSWSTEQLGGIVLGFGWNILTFFAIPGIALAGEGPLRTARRSPPPQKDARRARELTSSTGRRCRCGAGTRRAAG